MPKKNYAMVTINIKQADGGQTHVRRVLISYADKLPMENGGVVYSGTKFIAADPYFSDASASHKYVFYDHAYKLADADIKSALLYCLKAPIYDMRSYHSFDGPYKAIEFASNSESAAIKRFNARKELR